MIVVDSNVWIAFLHKNDNQHEKAQTLLTKCEKPIIMPEYVLIEVATVLTQKAGKKIADEFLAMSMESKDIEILFVQDQFFLAVADFFRKCPGKKLSFIDMALLYISQWYHVATFDNC